MHLPNRYSCFLDQRLQPHPLNSVASKNGINGIILFILPNEWHSENRFSRDTSYSMWCFDDGGHWWVNMVLYKQCLLYYLFCLPNLHEQTTLHMSRMGVNHVLYVFSSVYTDSIEYSGTFTFWTVCCKTDKMSILPISLCSVTDDKGENILQIY